jgi:2-methylcitrate dehydratase PrpD
MDVSRRLADALAATTFDDFPASVLEHARRAIVDWLGSALAGAIEPPARMAQGLVAGLGASDEATVFGARRASAAGAALANGVASHILELDDVHKASTLHPAAPVIPAALAVAEREHASGRAFLRAVILGYDAALRIGEAVNPSHYRYWHPTGTAGTFGAAIAASALLGADAPEMLHALGNAGTQASGLWEFNADGAMSKHLHPGKAAFNGVLAADLAHLGFTGATRILEGERGFFRATSADHDASRVTDGLGDTWKIAENCFKVHACCGHTHSAADIALQLRENRRWTRESAAADIEAIEVSSYRPGLDITRQMRPRTPYQAQFSIAYVVASALVDGCVGLAQFAPSRFSADGVRDLEIARLLGRTKVREDPALTTRYPNAWPARLTIHLRDGSLIAGSADYPLGNPENPVTTVVLEEKFRALVAPRLGALATDRALDAAGSLDDAGDMAAVFRDFGVPAGA